MEKKNSNSAVPVCHTAPALAVVSGMCLEFIFQDAINVNNMLAGHYYFMRQRPRGNGSYVSLGVGVAAATRGGRGRPHSCAPVSERPAPNMGKLAPVAYFRLVRRERQAQCVVRALTRSYALDTEHVCR